MLAFFAEVRDEAPAYLIALTEEHGTVTSIRDSRYVPYLVLRSGGRVRTLALTIVVASSRGLAHDSCAMNDAASAEPVLKLSRLLEMHQHLDELFLSHQERLLEGELAPAAALLDAHSAFFELHAKHEEELLLPIYVGLPFLSRFSVRALHRTTPQDA